MSEESVLVCHRVSDLGIANPESLISTCDQCGNEVRIMPDNLSMGIKIICYHCITPQLDGQDIYVKVNGEWKKSK